MPVKIDLIRTSKPDHGEIKGIIFGSKIITIKDKCKSGGSAYVNNNSETSGKIAKCTRNGAEIKVGR